MRRLPFLLLAALLLALSGCAAAPPSGSVKANAEVSSPVAVSPEPAERPFPEDSLYKLLAAEFALRRGLYPFALREYLGQAEGLRDAGVSAHTTHIAQFMGRDDEALRASQLWTELEPESLEARLTLANLLARAGRIQEALPQMETILRAGGSANSTALTRGFHALPEPEKPTFLAAIRSLLAEFPGNGQLRISRALLLDELGRKKEALKILQPVFIATPTQVQAVVLDAKLRIELGRKNAFRRLLPALKGQPDNHHLRTQYARLLTRTDLTQARRQFQLLVEQAPQDSDLLFSLGLIQRETGDLEGAQASLSRLLATGARADQAHYYLGRTAEDLQQPQAALAHYMEVRPGQDFGAAIDRIADLLLAGGEAATLGEHFNRLRGRHPQLAEQLFAIESGKLRTHQHPKNALTLLNRALAELPNSIRLRYSRSLLHEQRGDFAQAEEDLRSILGQEPDNATALNALGYMLANRTGRYTEAEQLISRALALSPEEPAILDSMGWVKYRLGQYEDALAYLQRAYAALPDPEVASHLGEVLWQMGRAGDARSIWNQALEASPEHAIILEAVQRLGAALAEE